MELIPVSDETLPDSIMGELKDQIQFSHMHFRLSCVITDKKGRVLGRGSNQSKTHPKFGAKLYRTLHAEASALYSCIKRGINVKGATAYVYRENGKLSKPCPCCTAILRKFGIKKVYYSFK